MKFGFPILFNVGLIASSLCLSTTAAPAMPMMAPSLSAPDSGPALETVRCRCGYRTHHRRRVEFEPAPYPYLYPAPPVGVTLRKIFGLGYL